MGTNYNRYYNTMVTFRQNYNRSVNRFRSAYVPSRDVSSGPANIESIHHCHCCMQFWWHLHWNLWLRIWKLKFVVVKIIGIRRKKNFGWLKSIFLWKNSIFVCIFCVEKTHFFGKSNSVVEKIHFLVQMSICKGQFTVTTIPSSKTISVERLPIKRHCQHWLHCPYHPLNGCYIHLDWFHSAVTPIQYKRNHHVRQPLKPFPVQSHTVHSNQSDTINGPHLHCLYVGQLTASSTIAR